MDLELTNHSDTPIEVELVIEESDDFHIGGELKSYLNLMPHDTYLFNFNLIPL